MSKKNVVNPKICDSRVTFDVPNEASFSAKCELPMHHADDHVGYFDETAELETTCGECRRETTKTVRVKASWCEPASKRNGPED